MRISKYLNYKTVGISFFAFLITMMMVINAFATPFDLSTAIQEDSKSITAQQAVPSGVFFRPDGTYMYVIGNSGNLDRIHEYSLTTAWNVTTATYTNVFLNVNPVETAPQDFYMRSDGLRIYVIGSTGDSVYQYNLSVAWDLTTASHVGTLSVVSFDTAPTGIEFKPDGTKMYVTGDTGNTIDEWNLTTAWDITSAIYFQEISVATPDNVLTGIVFSPDGKRMYYSGSQFERVYQYDLTTAWDISTIVFVQQLDVAGGETSLSGLYLRGDGVKLFTIGSSTDTVFGYTMPTWDNPPQAIQYDTTNLNWENSWFTLSAQNVITDIDGDGFADTAYTLSGSYPTWTLTKVFGTGASPITVDVGTEAGHSVSRITINKNSMWFTETEAQGGCQTDAWHVDILTGTTTNVFTAVSATTIGSNTSCVSMAWNQTNGTPTMGIHAHGATQDTNKIVSDVATLRDCSFTGSTNDLFIFSPVILSCEGTGISRTGTSIPSPSPSTGITNVLPCQDSECLATDGAFLSFPSTGIIEPASSIVLDPNIQFWNFGMKLPNQEYTVDVEKTLWKDYFPSINTQSYESVLAAHYRLYDVTDSNSPYRFLLNIGGTIHIGWIDNDIVKYQAYDILKGNNRAIQYYLPDTETASLQTLTTGSALPLRTYDVISPDNTYTGNSYGAFSLFSGYQYKVNGATRQIDPRWSNDSQLKPIIQGPTASLTEVTIQVKNAPSQAIALDIQDKKSLDGRRYTWHLQTINAAREVITALPTGQCFDIYAKDVSVAPSIWESLGEICAIGLMPKVLVYSSSLSFTFWSLPWGTAHTYDNDGKILTTYVRHKTPPFTYNVKVYNNDESLFSNTQYIGTGFDVRTQNISSATKPSKIEIVDTDSKILYFATAGYPNYFSQIQAWTNQNLEIDGFYLVGMMPLIFAAIWTRNTVAVGTTITVIMIMTMVFFGFIAIPEIALYMMLFIAAAGMIAYKLIFQ